MENPRSYAKHIKLFKMSKKKKLSKRKLLELILDNVRWNGDILEKQFTNQTKDGDDLVGDRPPDRP